MNHQTASEIINISATVNRKLFSLSSANGWVFVLKCFLLQLWGMRFVKCCFSQLPKGQVEQELIQCKINSIKTALGKSLCLVGPRKVESNQ